MVLFSLSSLSSAKSAEQTLVCFRDCRKAQCSATLGQLFQNPLEEGTASSQGSCNWESQQADPMCGNHQAEEQKQHQHLLCMKVMIR